MLQGMCTDNPTRNSNCHDHHAVENKMDTGRREHFQWTILRRCSQIFSLMVDWRVFCTRLKISAYSRQRAYLRPNKKSLRYFDIRSMIRTIFALFMHSRSQMSYVLVRFKYMINCNFISFYAYLRDISILQKNYFGDRFFGKFVM